MILDTSILIDHLQGHPAAVKLVVEAFEQQPEPLAASVMTKVELLAGMPEHQQLDAYRLMARINWVLVDEAIADRAGELAHTYMRSRRGVDPVDYVIAATVELLGAELWTRNIKHFPMFPELKAPYS